MNRSTVIASLLLLFSATAVSEDNGTLAVSLVQLIVGPQLYEGRVVQTMGHLDKAGMGLFLTRDYANAFDVTSSIAISDDTEDGLIVRGPCRDRLVLVEGRVANIPGRGWSLTAVSRIVARKPNPCEWQRTGP